MPIRYNEKTVTTTEETFEVAKSLTLNFPVRGNIGRAKCTAEMVTVKVPDGESPQVGRSRSLTQELNAKIAKVGFPILDSDGNPTGQNITVEQFFQIAESFSIRLATFQDQS